jgi:hypothetical protein
VICEDIKWLDGVKMEELFMQWTIVKWQGWPHIRMTIVYHMEDDDMEGGCSWALQKWR